MGQSRPDLAHHVIRKELEDSGTVLGPSIATDNTSSPQSNLAKWFSEAYQYEFYGSDKPNKGDDHNVGMYCISHILILQSEATYSCNAILRGRQGP